MSAHDLPRRFVIQCGAHLPTLRRARAALLPTLAGLALFAAPGYAAETTPQPGAKPWSDSFPMQLKGKERTYVVYQGNSYLSALPDDIADPGFLDQKDIMIAAKLGRVEGGKARFYNLAKLEASGPLELWRTRIDGDNLYVFGRVTAVQGLVHLEVVAAENAPSDQQVIAARLAGVPASDLAGRLAVANWAKEEAAQQGNREFWLVSSDTIVSQVVDDAAVKAESDKDVALAQQAVTWSLDLLHDVPRAARIASAPWIRELAGPAKEDLARRMRRLGLEFYEGQWRQRGEALAQEFQDRFAALGWKDADGFYKLGRWCDANSELLGNARELSYRCYQAGYRANSNHNGIRRELGMEPAKESDAAAPKGDFADTSSGIAVPGPANWNRTDPFEGADGTWIDAGSDTAFLSVRMVRSAEARGPFAALWAGQLAGLQARTGFTAVSDVALKVASGEARLLRYSYREGRYLRLAEMVVLQNPINPTAIRLEASAAENEMEAVHQNPAGDRGQGDRAGPAQRAGRRCACDPGRRTGRRRSGRRQGRARGRGCAAGTGSGPGGRGRSRTGQCPCGTRRPTHLPASPPPSRRARPDGPRRIRQGGGPARMATDQWDGRANAALAVSATGHRRDRQPGPEPRPCTRANGRLRCGGRSRRAPPPRPGRAMGRREAGGSARCPGRAPARCAIAGPARREPAAE